MDVAELFTLGMLNDNRKTGYQFINRKPVLVFRETIIEFISFTYFASKKIALR